MEAICTNCLVKNTPNDDADTRTNAVRALKDIIKTLGLEKLTCIKRIIDTLFIAVNDYSVDRRGDIGSWVREEAMVCFKEIIVAREKNPLACQILSVSN